ncbi:MAG: sterol desaturase family protein [Flavobacteriales bacterium]|nr:sterol desaturase family protein [Flavobacteriales bacterium]
MTLIEVFQGILESIRLPLQSVIDSESRLHILYLFSSLGLAYFVYRRSRATESFWSYVFRKDVWLSRSAFVDYGMIFFNSFFKVFLIAPYFIFGFYLSYKLEVFLPEVFGYPSQGLSATTTIILYTIVLTVVGDFATYLVHYIMHFVPFFWEFHKVHHSATTLNPVTQYRIHPVELIINNVKGILVLGLVTGVFRYLSAHPIEEMTLIGANVLSFAFLFFGSNLRHSHIPLKYFDWLEYIFISPFQHQIHHSDNQKHFNRNLGSKLAIWDWMFGTLIRSKSVETVQFGIGEDEKERYDSLLKNLYMPFKNLLATAVGRLSRTPMAERSR